MSRSSNYVKVDIDTSGLDRRQSRRLKRRIAQSRQISAPIATLTIVPNIQPFMDAMERAAARMAELLELRNRA